MDLEPTDDEITDADFQDLARELEELDSDPAAYGELLKQMETGGPDDESWLDSI